MKNGEIPETNTFNWESSFLDRSTYGERIDNEFSIKWNFNDYHEEARLTTKVI